MNNLERFSIHRYRKKPEVNIAPLVDMVFLLLIFFLVSTTFSRETGVSVRKPKAKTASYLSRESILVAVTREGTVHINNRRVDLETLYRIMKDILKQKQEASVIIIADKGAIVGRVIEVMDKCRQAGAKNISLSALKEE
ncbi:MAG: biopolymer transporter ExbD [Caldiserica bacterium]|nr:MAG: biopolymer transporter ExbD [Caldisericota bacterium]